MSKNDIDDYVINHFNIEYEEVKTVTKTVTKTKKVIKPVVKEVEVEEEEEDDEKGDTEDNANTVVIYEYFRPNDSTILLAAHGSRLESIALKCFANETFGRDSSALEGAVLMKVSGGPSFSVIYLIFNRRCYALINDICFTPNLYHTSTPFAIHHADE